MDNPFLEYTTPVSPRRRAFRWLDKYVFDPFLNAVDWFFRIGDGRLAVLVGVLVLVAVCIVGVCVGVKALNEAACHQTASQLGARSGDYRFLSDECWLTLKDGTVIPASAYRATERTHR